MTGHVDHKGASSASQDADKHYKMCKKIAQLTKVIYTLNNRSEDNEQRVAYAQQAHQAELSRLSQEYETQLEDLQKQAKALQADKASLARLFEGKQKELLLSAQEEYKARLAALTQRLSEQTSSFDSALREIKQHLAVELAAATKQVREGKDAEIARLVQEYNDKYKAMLTEQLDARDTLGDELNRKWSAKVEALEAELKASRGDTDAQLQVKVTLVQETLQKCAILANEKDALSTSLDAAQKHAQVFQVKLAKTEAELELERRQHKATQDASRQIKAQLSDLRAEAEAMTGMCNAAQEALETEKTAHAKRKTDQQACENENAVLRTTKTLLKEELQEHQVALRACTTERDAARDELAQVRSSNQATATSVRELHAELSIARQQMASLQSTLDDARRQHAAEMKRATETWDASTKQAAEALRTAQRQHEEALRSAQNALQSDASSAQQQLLATHKQQLKALQEQYEAEKEKLQAALAAAQERYCRASDDVSAHSAEVQRLTKQCEGVEAQLKTLTEKSSAEVVQLEQQLRQLRCDLDATRSSGQAEVGAQQAMVDQLKREHARAIAETKESCSKLLQELRDGEAARLDTVKREHVSLLKALQTDHHEALLRAKEGAAADAANTNRDASARLAAQQQAFAAQLEAQRAASSSLEKELRAEVAELLERLRRLQADAAAQQTSSADKFQQQQAELTELRDSLKKAHADAAAALEAARRTADAQRLQEISTAEAARQQQVQAERERFGAAAAAHKEEVADLELKWQRRVAAAEERLAATVSEMQNRHESTVRDLETRLTSRHETQMRDTTTAHEAERARLQSTLSGTQTQLNHQITLMANSQEIMQTVARQRDAVQEELRVEKQKAAAALVAAEHRLAADMEQLRVRHQKELNDVAATHKQMIDDCLQEVAVERAALQQLADQLRHQLEELQIKYDYRESRPEDVELINRLLRGNKEKEVALAKAYEDMRLYKLELINREENYNKVFRRSPAVADFSGVADAVAAKKGPATLPAINNAHKRTSR